MKMRIKRLYSVAEVEYDIEDEMDAADLQAYIKKLISELTPGNKKYFT
nr:hypothetical protein [Bacteroides fragilis]